MLRTIRTVSRIYLLQIISIGNHMLLSAIIPELLEKANESGRTAAKK